MTSQNINNSAPYLQTSREFPLDLNGMQNVSSKAYTEVAQSVNRRTIGTFNTFQIVTGDMYYSLNNNDVSKPIQYRQAYRKLFPFGTIAAGATLVIAHGISGITEIVHLYGNCITASSTKKFKPIPYVSVVNVNEQIQLYMDGTNITIVNGAGADNIISGTIIVEYLLN